MPAAPRLQRDGVGDGHAAPWFDEFWVMLETRLWLGRPCSRPAGREEQKDSSKSSSSLCFIKPLTPPPA